MARDIELILRAQDEAAKTINKVTAALKQLEAAQKNFDQSVGDRSSSITQVGEEIAKLNDEVSRLNQARDIAGNLSKTTQKAQELEKSLAGVQEQYKNYQQALNETKARQNELSDSLSDTRGNIAENIGELQRLKDARKDAAARLSTLETNARNVEREIERTRNKRLDLRRQLDDIRSAVDELDTFRTAAARAGEGIDDLDGRFSGVNNLNDLNEQIKNAERNLKQLLDSARRSRIDVGNVTDSLESIRDQVGLTKDRLDPDDVRPTQVVDPSEIDEARKSVKAIDDQIADLEKSTEDLKNRQKTLNKEYKSSGSAANKYQNELTKLDERSKELSSGLDDVNNRIDGLRKSARDSGVNDLVDSVDRIGKRASESAESIQEATERLEALKRVSIGGGQFAPADIAKDIREQKAAVEQARTSWSALRGELNRVKAEIGDTSTATNEQIGRLNNLESAVRSSVSEFADARGRLAETVQTANLAGANISSAAVGLGGFAAGIDTAARSFRNFGGSAGDATEDLFAFQQGGRKALSITERLRAELLSLTTAFIGVFAAIQGGQAVIRSIRELQGAENRLGAAFGNDLQKTRSELLFLEFQADRLGIGFEQLAESYTKFAFAASQGDFSGEAIRDIFLSVAEAGRVNEATTQQQRRAFLALEQMISKGVVSMEELRQQLGEQIPGAVGIFADGMEISTEKLQELVENADLKATEENLLKFAKALEDAFGGSLSIALKRLNAEIGRFQNNLFQSRLQVARGGFADSFRNALERLNDFLQSQEGAEFFLALGSAAGKAVEGLVELAEIIRRLSPLIGGLLLLKIGQFFTRFAFSVQRLSGTLAQNIQYYDRYSKAAVGSQKATQVFAGGIGRLRGNLRSFGSSLRNTQGILTGLSGGFVTFGNRLRRGATAANTMKFAMRGLNGAMRAGATAFAILRSAAGGVIGLLIQLGTVVGGSLLFQWITNVEDATKAMVEHRKILREVIGQYIELEDKSGDWAERIEGVSVDQANANVRRLRNALDSSLDEIRDLGTPGFSFGGPSQLELEVAEIVQNAERGKISIEELQAKLLELYDKAENSEVGVLIEELLVLSRDAEKVEQNLGEAARIAQKFGSDLDDLADDAKRTETSLEDLAEPQVEGAMDDNAEAAKRFTNALEEMRSVVPGLMDELNRLEKAGKLANSFATALQNAQTASERAQAQAIYNRGIAQLNEGRVDAPFNAAEARSRLESRAQPDVMVDALDGEVARAAAVLAEEFNLTVTSAFRDAARNAEVGGADKSRHLTADAVDFSGLDPADRERFVQRARQLGFSGIGAYSGGGVHVDARDDPAIWGDNHKAESAPQWLRDYFFSDLPAQSVEAQTEALREQFEEKQQERERIQEERERQREAGQELLETQERQLELARLRNTEGERAAAMAEAENQLRETNPQASDEQVQRARELAGAIFDQRQQEQQVNNLLNFRREILRGIEIAEENGNVEKEEQLRLKLKQVNAELRKAIDLAIQKWRAIGGPQADAAIQKLQNVRAQLGQNSTAMSSLAKRARGMLVDGLTGAFDSFAQAIANGENAVKALGQAFLKFAADFLIQIGKMIVKQALFNALQGGGGGGGGGGGFNPLGFIGNLFGFHSGGVVGGGGGYQIGGVSPAVFSGAARYHSGGIASNEVPAILKEGEEVLTENDPRHRRNGGGSGSSVKIVNAFDSGDVVAKGVSTVPGEEAIINVVRSNRNDIKNILDRG